MPDLANVPPNRLVLTANIPRLGANACERLVRKSGMLANDVMEPPNAMIEQHHSTRNNTAVAFTWVALGFFLACASALPDPVPHANEQSPDAHEKIEVRLVFGRDADLDLYLTDPQLETVYFGNNPSLSGGVLSRDARCEDPAPRVEAVNYDKPLAGRYRVGVEYAERCRRIREAVPFRVEINAKGIYQEVEGEISPGHFESIVVEFEVTD